MAAPVLQHYHLFGFKSDVFGAVHYVDENLLLYVCGHNLVLWNSDTKQQRFIQATDVNGPQGRVEINALTISPNKRYVAFAERGSEKGTITIYDLRTLKKRKILQSHEMKSREYVSLSFSTDSKSLLSLGGGPDYTLINWQWQKSKPINIIQIPSNGQPLYSATSCPADPTLICVHGRNTVLFYHAEIPAALAASSASADESLSVGLGSVTLLDNSFASSSFVAEDYLSSAWLNEKRIVIGTASGKLLLFDNTLFKGYIKTTDPAHNEFSSSSSSSSSSSVLSRRGVLSNNNLPAPTVSVYATPKSIECIAAYANGNAFVIGCDNNLVKTFTINQNAAASHEHNSISAMASSAATSSNNSTYVISRHFLCDNVAPTKIKHVCISPSEDHLVIGSESQQLLTLRNFHTDVLKSEDMRFEFVSVSFHAGQVTGMDTCVRKPIVVTCGTDKSVRVWNYLNKQLELCVYFAEIPHSIALHPSGLHVLVGFSDKLRLMNVLMDDIRPYKEFQIKNCSEVQFSHGGHLFAAINVGLIQIYNTYTCEQVAVFRGHTGLVKSLFWSLDDTNIVSAGVDGAVYERKLGQTARTQEHVQKGCKFSSAICTEDEKIYAVGDDRMLKEIIDKNVTKTLDAGVILTQIIVSNPPQRMLFAGTANGVVRSFAYPLTGVVKDYQCHSRAVNRLKITNDDAFLFSSAEDGSLAIFQIKEKDGRLAKRDRPDAVSFSEEVLVTKSDLEEKGALMLELRSKVDDLTASNEYQLKMHEMNYNEKLKEVSEKYHLQIEHDKSKIEMLRDEKTELEMELEEKIQMLKANHANVLHGHDLEHQKSIMKEVSRYQRLQEELEGEIASYETYLTNRQRQHEQELSQLKEKMLQGLMSEMNEVKKETLLKENVMREYNETKYQLEEDIDVEVESLKDKYDQKLATERDATLRLKGENGIMKKKFTALQKDIEDQKENIKSMAEKEESLLTHIKSLQDRIDAHKNEIKERDKTIGENERAIYDLKKDNQELEKFKFVLDYQIQELKRQIEPRENEIAEMKDLVMKKDSELENFHKQNGSLKQKVDELKEKLQDKMLEIRVERQSFRTSSSELDSLSNDLFELVSTYIQNPIKLKEEVKQLYQKHVTEKIQNQELDPDVNKEYKRQKIYLEKSVDVLKKKLNRDMKARKNDNMRLMQENVSLIKEINKLRREIKLMHQVQRQKELNTATKPAPGAPGAPTQPAAGADYDGGAGGTGGSGHGAAAASHLEKLKLSELQRAQILNLRMKIEEAQNRLQYFRPAAGMGAGAGGSAPSTAAAGNTNRIRPSSASRDKLAPL